MDPRDPFGEPVRCARPAGTCCADACACGEGATREGPRERDPAAALAWPLLLALLLGLAVLVGRVLG